MGKNNKEPKQLLDTDKDHCCICGVKIEAMTFRGTGVCSENHRKLRDNDTAPANLMQAKGGV